MDNWHIFNVCFHMEYKFESALILNKIKLLWDYNSEWWLLLN